jgi:hypothetical protein
MIKVSLYLQQLSARCILLFFNGSFQPIEGPDLLSSSVITLHRRQDSLGGDRPVVRLLPTHRTTQTQNTRIDTPNIKVLSGIWTHNPNVRASEDSSGLRPRGYCDRLYPSTLIEIHGQLLGLTQWYPNFLTWSQILVFNKPSNLIFLKYMCPFGLKFILLFKIN